MAALLDCFKQVWTSILDAFGRCCGKTNEDPATTTVEVSTGPDGEVNITTLAAQLDISSGGGGSTHADLVASELKTSTETRAYDVLSTSMISSGSGGGGSTH
ncbi:hypothetical protein L1987_23544 [Smallanthus sonchifolius]|uniref:Uncharacterized protein n=1 Tax=Smallanthus sonchifolius TaxID=185202 RepID=A0ACB9IIU0_9ASTR|nr:hypothetical protein L1987_23544 [Smallanthus sonchifolius]